MGSKLASFGCDPTFMEEAQDRIREECDPQVTESDFSANAMIGALVATPFIFAFFDQQPGESAWQWLVFGPFIFVGGIFGFQYWRMASGADAYFGLTGDSHGSGSSVNLSERDRS